MTPKWYVPRRTILRGIGTGVALPFLEAMVPPRGSTSGRALAAVDPRTNPRRFVGMWGFPCGLPNKWDPIQASWVSPWTPAQEGPLGAPDPQGFLKPFWDPQNQGANKAEPLYKKLSILTGLSDVSCGLHQSTAALLTPGRFQCRTEDNFCQDLPFDVRAPSADQVAAKHLGQFTDVPFLALGTHPPYYGDSAYVTYLSWKDHVTPQPKDIDPGAVFDKLFQGTFNPKEDPAIAEQRKLYRKTVMDTVLGHAKAIEARVGKADQAKLGQYFEGIQDIEKNISKLGVPLSCDPGTRPVPGTTPGADDISTRQPDRYINQLDKRLPLMMDLLVKAFECDRTRVATLTYIRAYGAPYGYPFLTDEAGNNMGGLYHHDMSHYAGGATGTPTQRTRYMNAWGKWVVKQYAYFLGELDKRLDPDGNTLLDNSAIYIGGDCADGDIHSWSSMHGLLAGRGGRAPSGRWAINAGRHVRCSTPFPDDVCGGTYASHDKFYCRGPDGKQLYAEETRTDRMPDHQYPGERTVKDLVWGMMDAIGIPSDATKAWASAGTATAPLDLTFPGKA